MVICTSPIWTVPPLFIGLTLRTPFFPSHEQISKFDTTVAFVARATPAASSM